MAKSNRSQSILQNVYLLYALFIAALLHLGYFVLNQETILLVSFSLAVVFVYLVNPNMVVVLATSLVFVDMLYLVKKVPEGFEDSIDGSGSNVSTETKALTLTNLLEKASEIHSEESKKQKDSESSSSVESTGTLKEKMTGKSIDEDNQESNDVKSIVTKLKDSNPELAESLLQLNSVDINELNKLINNLSGVAKSITKDVV